MKNLFRSQMSMLCFLLTPFILLSQNEEQKTIAPKSYFTKKIINEAPIIDGVLDDTAWNQVEWGSDFVQRRPYEGEAPTQKTSFKILYDNKNLYIAYKCFDTEPEKVVRRLSRRDGFEGDWVEVNIDSYHDKRTAFSFTVSAAGVKSDELISGNGDNFDESWDPIWYTKAQIDKEGWTAEMRIPLSQLRFSNEAEQVWGLQIQRRDFRANERSLWRLIPQNAGVWVSEFGTLHGLKGLVSQKQLEIQPYTVGKLESFKAEEGNPFATGSDSKLSIGIDGKIGITSDLIVDFTINPDFGQVEADPAALTLDGFQIFFQERRPFFIESRNIFDYRLTPSEAGGPYGRDNLFYSRRIGRAPQGNPDLADGEFADLPENTSIIGSAKFSGKTKQGVSIGILESITAREYAIIDNDGDERKEVIEPLSNYFVGRVQKDYNDGNTVFGGIFTATNRDLKDTNLDFLHQSAYTGGFDFLHRWNDRKYYLTGNAIISRVNGSENALLETQTSHERYYQRTDADYLSVDSSLTSLIGHGGTIKLGKNKGKFVFDSGVTWRSPGLSINDLGFMRRSDFKTHFFWGGYRIQEPFGIFNNIRFNYNHWATWDFGGDLTYIAWNVNTEAQFKNNYWVGTGFNLQPYRISNSELRGGPSLRQSNSFNNWTFISSDRRKKISFNLFVIHSWAIDDGNDGIFKRYNFRFRFQPLRTLNISVGPSYNLNKTILQNVQHDTYKGEDRYITGTVEQRTLSMSVRVNYTIKPNLTLQYYAQPFISKGNYSDFKYITNPLAKEFDKRFHAYTANQINYEAGNEEYNIDEDGDGNIDYSFGKPDFNFMQFRSNLVLRWEYIPGSEFYLVWSQGVTNSGNPNDELVSSLRENLFEEKAHNIFLAKITYRFLR